ncbi:MAG: hypothetical protein IPK94_09855 [Saprospiraceae bacterium]|jgi:hypothetical protein|nr:hypothetical protein [Saprospiraceae bacterium]MBK7439925.1 hypothetical protein [Saprospiraceae bacterium]MBK8280397.1 hypothetical protein [Saprospiraceae bacterium]MBK8513139.1 hypothetical protein [Saprospiraceae bacterium]MBK9928662.1 hypothetical protein [Saprospiraceae bacterium]
MINSLKIILFLCSSLWLNSLSAQFDVIRGSDIEDYMLIKQQDPFGRQADDVLGSPYLNDTFKVADVYTTKGIFKDVLVRYDVYRDWIEFLKNNQTFILDPSADLLKVDLHDQAWYVQPYEEGGRLKLGFFKMLVGDKVKLMVRKTVKFQDRKLAKALEAKGTPPQYVPGKDQYYLRVDTRPSELLYSAKKIADLLPDHKNSIASYIKRKKVSLKEAELLELMAYYQKLDEK